MIWNTPISIGNFHIKNRIVFPPISCNWASVEGFVTDKIINFYKDIVNGGCGMIVVGGTAVTPEGRGTNRSLVLNSDKYLDSFKRLATIFKTNGCFSVIQLMHVGGQGNPIFTDHMPVSPSGFKCKATGIDTRELTAVEIRDIRENFVSSALLAFRAGFHAVELHLAHGYLLHEFLSEYTNNRKDEYGGNIENRIRLINEIISGIREKEPDLIIGVRVSAEDYIDYGISEKCNRNFLPILEKSGVKYFSVTAGIYETSALKHKAMQAGEFFRYSSVVKSLVNKPVIGVGKILDIEHAEQHLEEGDCDMVAIGRGMIADPYMVRKTINKEPITMCTECNQCQYLRFGRENLSCPLREWHND